MIVKSSINVILVIFFCFTIFSCILQENAAARMDWTNAKPFDTIPGPKMWTLISRHLPGGKSERFFGMRPIFFVRIGLFCWSLHFLTKLACSIEIGLFIDRNGPFLSIEISLFYRNWPFFY